MYKIKNLYKKIYLLFIFRSVILLTLLGFVIGGVLYFMMIQSIRKPMPPLHRAVRDGDIVEVERLIDEGARINEVFSQIFRGSRNTPLSYAVFRGKVEIVKLLIEKGADINKDCPLYFAVKYHDMEIVNILLEAGALPDGPKRRVHGLRPMECAAREGDIEMIDILLEYNAKIDDDIAIEAAESGDIETIQRFMEEGISFTKDIRVAYNAAAIGSMEVILFLESIGVDFTDDDYIMVQAVRGDDVSLVKYFIDKGANVNAVDPDGESLLGIARYRKYEEMIDLLVKHGAK